MRTADLAKLSAVRLHAVKTDHGTWLLRVLTREKVTTFVKPFPTTKAALAAGKTFLR